MELSVIIPTINRYEDLLNTVKDLSKQLDTKFEVLIIDQSDQVNHLIVDQIKAYEFVKYDLVKEIKSASAARNIGISKSKGDVLLFIDDDVIIDDPTFLKKHLRHYRDDHTPGVFGCPLEQSTDQKREFVRPRLSYKNPYYGWLFFRSNYGCHATIAVGRSNNLSVRRAIAIAVGGMDENFDKGAHREEGDFCLRVRNEYGDFVYDPEAVLIHIGNRKGGIRSWNDSSYIRPFHHLEGAFYFVIKSVSPKYWFIFIPDLLRYSFLNKQTILRPQIWLTVANRVTKAFISAWKKKVKGPVYLKSQIQV